MAFAVRRLTTRGDSWSRFHLRVVAILDLALHGCPPLHHSITACGGTEAAAIAVWTVVKVKGG